MQTPGAVCVHNHCTPSKEKKHTHQKTATSSKVVITAQQRLFKTLLLWCQLKPGRGKSHWKTIYFKQTQQYTKEIQHRCMPVLAMSSTTTTNSSVLFSSFFFFLPPTFSFIGMNVGWLRMNDITAAIQLYSLVTRCTQNISCCISSTDYTILRGAHSHNLLNSFNYNV